MTTAAEQIRNLVYAQENELIARAERIKALEATNRIAIKAAADNYQDILKLQNELREANSYATLLEMNLREYRELVQELAAALHESYAPTTDEDTEEVRDAVESPVQYTCPECEETVDATDTVICLLCGDFFCLECAKKTRAGKAKHGHLFAAERYDNEPVSAGTSI